MPDTPVRGRTANGLREIVERTLGDALGSQSAPNVDDEWAIHPQTARLLEGLVGRLRPRSILEFGAGRSSLVLAGALDATGGGRLTSVEHQPTYARQAWENMRQFPAVDALMVEAGLGVRLSRYGLLYEYLGIRDALRERGPFDLVFIDAPPGHMGRDATLLAAGPFISPGAVAVLDDAIRPQEKTAVKRWQRALGAELVFTSDVVGRGVAVLSMAAPASGTFSLRTFVGTIHDRVVSLNRGA